MSRFTWSLALPAVLLSIAPASAVVLYSIDVGADELVVLDSTTGTVVPVGPVGYNFVGAGLAMLGGTLYATNLPQCVNAVVDLVAINPDTGAKISQVRVKSGASDLVTSAADGLTSDGATLLLSYRTAGLCGAAHNLADLATTGALSNVTTFPSATADMDGLAVSPSGQIYGYDGVSGSPTRADLYAVTRPSSYVLVGSHSSGTEGYVGLVFDASGDLWAYRLSSHLLCRLDPANGQVLESIPIATARSLRGLAVSVEPVSTESTSWSRIKGAYR